MSLIGASSRGEAVSPTIVGHSKRYFKIYSLLISGYYISPTVIKRILLKFFTLLMAV